MFLVPILIHFGPRAPNEVWSWVNEGVPCPSPSTARHVHCLLSLSFPTNSFTLYPVPTLKPAQRLASEAASKTHISRDAQTISDPHFLALSALSYGVFRKELPPSPGPGAAFTEKLNLGF